MCAPACSNARGRQPSSHTSSSNSTSFPVLVAPHRTRRNLLASSSEKDKTSTQQDGSRSTELHTSFDSRLVVSRMWPCARLFHRPDRIMCICSENFSWSTSSRTINQGFSCLEIHKRSLDRVKSNEFASMPKRRARSLTELSNFLSSSMENQNTPPSYSCLRFQAK